LKNELETNGRRKVLILGKLPPPYMGPSVAFQLIIQSGLKDIFNLLYLDIKANESLASLGKWSFKKLIINFQKYRQLATILAVEKPELVLLPVSQSTIGFLKDSIYLLICILYKRKVVIQLRGGNFRNWFDSTSFISKRYIKFILGKTCGVIVQGKNLKQLFNGFFSEENIFVVPNGGDFVFG